MIWMRKFVGFRVLERFLTHPSEEIHLTELARELKISPASAKTYCDALVEDGLILEEAKGNLRLFRLNFRLRLRFNHHWSVHTGGADRSRIVAGVGCGLIAIVAVCIAQTTYYTVRTCG